MNYWYRTKDILPDVGQLVLCYLYGMYRVLYFDYLSRSWRVFNSTEQYHKNSVTHWTELPPAPKEDDHDV